jgi:hypothetical protein
LGTGGLSGTAPAFRRGAIGNLFSEEASMRARDLRLCLGAIALAALSLAALPRDSEAQQRWSYANTAQYQIRHISPGQACPPGFGAQTFNYAGWGVRTHCISCPAGYIFAATAGTYGCVNCPPGTSMGTQSGYVVCNKP